MIFVVYVSSNSFQRLLLIETENYPLILKDATFQWLARFIFFNPTPMEKFLARLHMDTILQRIPGAYYLFFFGFSVVGPAYAPVLFSAYYLVMHCFFAYNSVRSYWGAKSAYFGAVQHSKTNWREKYLKSVDQYSCKDLSFDDIRHVIIIPQYKENLATMFDTLRVLASHSNAIANYTVICKLMIDLLGDGTSR
jgi:hypothetical protein